MENHGVLPVEMVFLAKTPPSHLIIQRSYIKKSVICKRPLEYRENLYQKQLGDLAFQKLYSSLLLPYIEKEKHPACKKNLWEREKCKKYAISMRI